MNPIKLTLVLCFFSFLASCKGPSGPTGPVGPPGPVGPVGEVGPPGEVLIIEPQLPESLQEFERYDFSEEGIYLVFKDVGPNAVRSVRQSAKRYVFEKARNMAEQESLYCQNNYSLSNRGLFFSQISLAASEISTDFANEIFFERRFPEGQAAVIRFGNDYVQRLTFKHISNLAGYVESKDREKFLNKYQSNAQ